MEQLLAHLIGDYLFQNDYVGTQKKDKTWKGFWYCLFHCTTYGLVFILITCWQAALIIGIGHFLIDRWNFVGHFIKTKNFVKDTKNFGYRADRPFAITIWLYIIEDNIFHLIWNYGVIWLFINL